MVRRAVALLVVAGCTGSIDAGGQVDNLTPAQQLAQSAWLKKALPVFKPTCTMCHDGSMAAAPAYLMGMTDLDIRDTAIAFMPPVVNLGAPQSSRVATKGAHEGPALTAPQISDILIWIQYEHDARPPGMLIETAQMTPVLDGTTVNKIDLSALGSPGSSVNFIAQAVGPDLYMTGLGVTAGASGLSLAHPLFESYVTGMMDPTPDPADQFFNVALDLAANATAKLGDGTVTFPGFSSATAISIRFDALANKM